ncbi:L,D-transpeptidase [bacterium]|nr:MAG: L,D-transpeptidase [bacterium]
MDTNQPQDNGFKPRRTNHEAGLGPLVKSALAWLLGRARAFFAILLWPFRILLWPFKKGSIARPIIIAAIILLVVPLLVLEGMGARKVYSTAEDIVVGQSLPEKKPTVSALEDQNASLQKKIDALVPRGMHIIVDTAANRLYLKDGEKLVREAIVSCGSGNILSDPKGDRTWVFDTPRGEYKIENKITNPVWVKPDWAFVEEGKTPPPRNSPDRVESGVLGDYALAIGKGYFLHGTMYTRMLGRNVTHGCVRIGDEDLKYIYENAPKGTKVYIY